MLRELVLTCVQAASSPQKMSFSHSTVSTPVTFVTPQNQMGLIQSSEN